MYGSFNAKTEWGSNLAIPSFDANGRWENIPICPSTTYHSIDNESKDVKASQNKLLNKKSITNTKRFQLVACTWTSAVSFYTAWETQLGYN